jgi:hypothetical protein
MNRNNGGDGTPKMESDNEHCRFQVAAVGMNAAASVTGRCEARLRIQSVGLNGSARGIVKIEGAAGDFKSKSGKR